MSTVGIEAEDSRIESLLSEVSGKSVDELIAEGSAKLGSVPSGGASSGGAAAASGSAAPAAGKKILHDHCTQTDSWKAEEKVEEKAEEKEESDDDMGFGLFD